MGGRSFSGVTVFGDSLVDAGNALALAETYNYFPFTSLPNGAPTTARGYFNGRFTDGYAYTDLIAMKYVGVATKPVFPFGYDDPYLGISFGFFPDPSGNNLNFAYGGAQVRQGGEAVPDLDDQTDAFRDAVDGHADPNALYTFTFGGNDVHDMVPKHGAWMDLTTARSSMQKDIAEYSEELRQVLDTGARHILVTGIPDIGIQPYYNGLADETERRAIATEYCEMLDAMLRTALESLQTARPAAELVYVSFTDMADSIFHSLEQIYPASEIYPLNESRLVFLDRLHPTAQLHALAAAHVIDVLNGQPSGDTIRMVAPDLRRLDSIDIAQTKDTFLFSLSANTTYTFEVLGLSSGSLTEQSWQTLADPRIQVLAPDGTVVASNDDAGLGLDAWATFTTVHAGDYQVEVSGVGMLTGRYALQADNQTVQNNTYTITSATTLVVEGPGGGTDRINTSVSYALRSGASIELLRTIDTAAVTAINLTGNEVAQTVNGNAGNNVLAGLGGNDILVGLGGNDILDGGLGNDQLHGGVGADRYYVDSALDRVTELAGEGADSIYSSVSYALRSGSEVELLRTTDASATTALSLTGNTFAQTIAGNAGANLLVGLGGNDTLDGGAGADKLYGGLGDDVLVGGGGADRFMVSELGGTDRIADLVHGEDYVDLRQIDANTGAAGDQFFTFIGSAAFTGTAGELRAFTGGNGTNYAMGDVNGDGTADFVINLGAVQAQRSDFLL